MNKFYLPNIKKISIYDYTLYECPLIIDFSSKLNIIYGTNGTGKSTLLMIILFSIVGPYRGGIKTKVRNEQRRDNRPLYDESFFKDRMIAYHINSRVISEFTIQNDEYIVEHSLDDGRLLSATVNGKSIFGKVVSYKTYETKYFKPQDGTNGLYANNEINEYLIYNYQESLKSSTRLPGGVNTLISMLLDVMFFDEGRNLTFWNSDLQETIIGKYIVDADFYESYCEKKLNTKALESSYKKKSETLNFMSKFIEKEKKENNVNSNKSEIELRIELNNIENDIINLERLRNDDQQLYDKRNNEFLNQSRNEEFLKEKIVTLEDKWYSNLFPNHYNTYFKRFSNKMLEGTCPICGHDHEFDLITENCIMCKEKLLLQETPDLVKIDIERRNSQNMLSQTKTTIAQIKNDLDIIKNRINQYRKQIDEKNLRKNQIEIHLKPDNNSIENSDNKRLDKAKQDRDQALLDYNASKKEEENMRNFIENNLVDNFNLFKSTFLKYAASFFGEMHKENLTLPFNDDNSLDKLMIKFQLDGKDRDESYMLSESQRIFTDLAFRFSILTTFHDNSFFICETPDSTLDMFHEEKAVKTFEVYINKGNSLILTANARKSNLISTLYKLFEPSEVSIIDLTQISKLALNEKFSFKSYIGGIQNESR